MCQTTLVREDALATGMEKGHASGAKVAHSPAGDTATKQPRTRRRWFMVAMCFFGLTINYIDRSNLSVALPKMKTALHLGAGAEGVDAFALADGSAAALKIEDGNSRARTPVTAAILARLGAQPPAEFATIAVSGGGHPVGQIRAAVFG